MFKKIATSIRNNTIVGIILVTPLVATILIFKFLFGLTTNWMAEFGIFEKWRGTWWELPLRIGILLFIILAMYMVGVLVRNILGRRLYQLSDKILAGLPFINGIYVAVRQISEALFTQRNTLFKKVVILEYPRKGIFSMAFVTSSLPKGTCKILVGPDSNEPCVSLFVPTTPNPTSGVLILAPESEVISVDMPVSEALTFVMSAGAVSPGDEPGSPSKRPTLLDKLEAWIRHEEQGPGNENTSEGKPTA